MELAINTVFVCPSLYLRDTVIKAIEEASGVRPAMKSRSVSANRAHYAPAISRVIINTASPQMHRAIGPHSCVIALEVIDRVDAANRAQKVFEKAGFNAYVETHAEPEFPDGFLVFVAVPALEGIALLFWPRPEDISPEVGAGLPKREVWSDADLG